ncbi:MAG: hypothetical protein Q8O67_05300 [Deltaproteobacteria bacterium]|nr:hypothetical protein [Deltaproteobacteria bacterium]
MKRLLLSVLLLAPGCATDGETDDTCNAILLGIALIPCTVAYGVGCVAGAGTRCCEGDESAPPAAATSTTTAEFDPLPAAREAIDARY